jgi:Protein of unknown function (DUF3305)
MAYTRGLMSKPSFAVAVVMQRRAVQNRWIDCVWEPWGVLATEERGAARLLLENQDATQWLHPGFTLHLHRDEAEGYYLNVSGPAPSVFILWRMDEERGLPVDVTVSSEEAGRWLDGGHSVDRVAMPAEIFAWVGDYVEHNYRPEPKQRIKPRSFKHPKDRV